MRAFTVLLILLLILFLISLIRVGGVVEYSTQGLLVRVRAGRLRFTVFPMKKREKKPKAPKKKKEKPMPPPSEPRKAGGTLELVKEFLPLVAEAAGRFKRKIRVDQLDVELTVAGPNPAMAAMAFGGANAVLGMMIPLLENNFKIKERSIRTAVDFDRDSPVIYLKAALSLTIGQGMMLALRLGIKALGILWKYRRIRKQKEAI